VDIGGASQGIIYIGYRGTAHGNQGGDMIGKRGALTWGRSLGDLHGGIHCGGYLSTGYSHVGYLSKGYSCYGY